MTNEDSINVIITIINEVNQGNLSISQATAHMLSLSEWNTLEENLYLFLPSISDYKVLIDLSLSLLSHYDIEGFSVNRVCSHWIDRNIEGFFAGILHASFYSTFIDEVEIINMINDCGHVDSVNFEMLMSSLIIEYPSLIELINFEVGADQNILRETIALVNRN